MPASRSEARSRAGQHVRQNTLAQRAIASRSTPPSSRQSLLERSGRSEKPDLCREVANVDAPPAGHDQAVMTLGHVAAEEVGHRIAGRLDTGDRGEAFGECDWPGAEAHVDSQLAQQPLQACQLQGERAGLEVADVGSPDSDAIRELSLRPAVASTCRNHCR